MGYSTDTTTYQIHLYYPTAPSGQVNLRAPEYGNSETVDRRQVVHESAGGDLIVYDRGPQIYFVALDFRFMDRTDRNNLETFYNSTVAGGKTTFELDVPRYDNLDANGDASGHYRYAGCQFDQGPLEFMEIRNGWYSTSVRVRATGRSTV